MTALIGNPLLLTSAPAASDDAYQIEKSLRFNDSEGAFLKRTFNAGNTRTWTWAAWVKRSTLGVQHNLFSAYTDDNNQGYLVLESDDAIAFDQRISGTWSNSTKTARLFRDTSAWFHITFVFDSTNASEEERIRLFINGERVTSWEDAPNCTQYLEGKYNSAIEHQIGKGQAGSNYMDGYLADVQFIDGLALSAAAFGEFDSTGVWNPAEFKLLVRNNGSTWSGMVAGTEDSGWTKTSVFNGNTGNSGRASAGNTLTFTPTTKMERVASLRVFADHRYGSQSSATLLVNGTNYSYLVPKTSGAWVEIPETTVETIAWSSVNTTSGSSGDAIDIGAIEVDGEILVDGQGQPDKTWDEWSTVNKGATWSDNLTNSVGFQAGAYAADAAFNGVGFSGTTFAANTGVSGSTFTFTPSGGITVASSIEIGAGSGGSASECSYTLNGGSSTAFGDGTGAEQKVVISGAVTLTTLTVTCAQPARLYYIKVDGVMLTDGHLNTVHLKFNDVSIDDALGYNVFSPDLSTTTDKSKPILKTNSSGSAVTSGYNTDANASNLVLAIPGTANGSTTIDVHQGINTGSSNKAASNIDPSVSSAYSQYYGNSLYFNNGAVEFADSTDFDFGTGDYTIEAWVNAWAQHDMYIFSVASGGTWWGLNLWSSNGSNGTLRGGLNTKIEKAYPWQAGQWYHVALVRSSGTLKLYLDGVEMDSESDTDTCDCSGTVYVGRDPLGWNLKGKFYLNDLRVYKGFAKYTSNFNPYLRKDFKINNLTAKTSGINYEGNTTAAASGVPSTIDSTYNLAKLYAGGGDSAYIATTVGNIKNNAGATLTLTFNPAIAVSSSVVFRPYIHGNCSWSYNGSSNGSENSTAGWSDKTISSPGSSMTSLAFTRVKTSGSDNGSAEISRIVVDGVELMQSQYKAAYEIDSSTDTPTNYGTDEQAGGEVRGNYCTWNPLDITTNGGNYTLSQGNLFYGGNNDAWTKIRSTMTFTTGKWYFEVTIDSDGYGNATGNTNNAIGIGTVSYKGISNPNSDGGAETYFGDNGWYHAGFPGTWTNSGSKLVKGDVIGVAFDCDARSVTWYKNGSQVATASSLWTAGTLVAPVNTSYYRAQGGMHTNFGALPFKHSAPAGYKALCTQNLDNLFDSETSENNPSKYFDVKTWTGNAIDDYDIQDFNFQPDLVWIKERDSTGDNHIFDAIRGATKALRVNETDAEVTDANELKAFNTDGFRLGTGGDVNADGTKTVAWAWDAGTAAVTPIDSGGITPSAVWKNRTAGFSITQYAGSGSNHSVPHDLGAKPDFYVVKKTTGVGSWRAWHSSLDSGKSIDLHSDAAQFTDDSFTQEVDNNYVYLNGSVGNVNASGSTYIIYAWTSIPGYSAFGSYKGNGSADGPFIHLGFNPKYFLMKNKGSASTNWIIYDTERADVPGANPNDQQLHPDGSFVEGSGKKVDFVSNGIKIRDSNAAINNNNVDYIYSAWAEHPFKTTRAV